MNFLESLNVIGRFTETAIVKDGKTYFTDASKTFFGMVESETPNQKDVGFYDNISNFQRVISLFEEPEITLDDATLKIKDATGDAKFVTSDIRLIQNLQDIDIERAVTQTLAVSPTLSATITKDTINRIKTASTAIANSKVVIHSRNGEIEFIVKDVDVLMSSSNSYKFKIQGESSKDCSVVVDASFFGKLGNEFNLSLVFSEKASTFRAILQSEEATIVIPTAHTAV